MENNSSQQKNNYDNKYSNEKVKKYLEKFFEIEEIWKSENTDLIKNAYQQDTLIEKYCCEEKYVDVVRCLDKTTGFQTLHRCEYALEELGRCLFDRIQIANSKI